MFEKLTPILFTTIVYLFIIIGFRLLGKKELGQLTITDLIFVLLISEVCGPAMLGGENSLLGGIIAASTLMLLNKLLEYLMYKSKKFTKLIEGSPSILIRNGKINRKELEKNQVKVEELEQIARSKGKGDISKIGVAILESDGKVSILDDPDFKSSEKFNE